MSLIKTIAVVWALSCLAGGSLLAFWVNDNEAPYVWDEGPPKGESYIAPNPAEQQSMITANWKLIDVRRTCPATLQRLFHNGDNGRLVTSLDMTEASRSVKVGDTVVPRSFQLPPDLPWNTDYSTIVCFACNPYQAFVTPLCVTTPKIRFNVKPNAYGETVR